jgi:leader peptidase (prepilin peptidase)/N-methyltransferase
MIFGLLAGSFLNVCIYRIPRGESIVWPSSHCTSCGSNLKPIDLVPVFSFLFLKGRCRYCKEKISIRYPLIELLTSGIFISLFLKFGISLEFIVSIFFMAILIAVFFIDMDNQIIPNELVIAGLIIGVLLVATEIIFKINAFGNIHWWDHLLGIIPGTVFLLLVALLGMLLYKTEDVMGMGDVKIFAPIGLILGWKLCIVALFISIFLGGITSVILILLKIKDRKDLIPFGPFIVAGTFITFLFGSIILEWYLRFL